METYEVEIEMLGDVVQNRAHPISGKDKVKWDDIPDSRQLEMRGHLTDNGTYGIPLTYFNGCLRDYFVEFSPWGSEKGTYFSSKDKRKNYISGKLRVIPSNGSDMIDTEITSDDDDFEIKKTPITVNNMGSTSLSTPVQPLLKLRGKKFIIHVASAVEDRPMEEIKKLINEAGIMCGIGSWRSGGKGRFRVSNIKKIQT